ncbi:MAG: hypothetical protein Q9223_001228 [Gallowayella weberi]
MFYRARRAGLLSEPHLLDRRINETVVQAVLEELQNLLLDTEKLKDRYKLRLSANPSAKRPGVDERIVESILSGGISNDTRRYILHEAGFIQGQNHFPRRLWWAFVDKSKFVDYVTQIRSFVQDLWRLLDPLRQDEMAASVQMVLSHIVGVSNKVDELRSLQDTLQLPSFIPGSSGDTSQKSALASAAEIKAITLNGESIPRETCSSSLNQSDNFNNNPSQDTQSLHLLNHQLRECVPIKGSPDVATGKYDGRTVLVEWKTLPIHSINKIMMRVRHLALLLSAPKHTSFRSLRCKGIVHETDSSRIAFVFEIPEEENFQPPRPLRTMFGCSPSVADRVQLALKITESVRQFHTAGWLHKDLRSENILLWSPGDLAFSCPVLSGFAFARLDSPSELSEQPSADPQRDIYRHPEAMGDPSMSFTAAKDIYALGTILLEIGEWRSLRSLVERVVDVTAHDVALSQLAKIRPHLLDDGPKGGLATLRFRMGDIFARVTQMMISGSIPESLSLADEAGMSDIVRPNILDVAVRELGRCVI